MSAQLNDWMKVQGDTRKTFRKPYPISGPKPREVITKEQAKPGLKKKD